MPPRSIKGMYFERAAQLRDEIHKLEEAHKEAKESHKDGKESA